MNRDTQIPADLSYNLRAYRAIASDPVALAVGGATNPQSFALTLMALATWRDPFLTLDLGRVNCRVARCRSRARLWRHSDRELSGQLETTAEPKDPVLAKVAPVGDSQFEHTYSRPRVGLDIY